MFTTVTLDEAQSTGGAAGAQVLRGALTEVATTTGEGTGYYAWRQRPLSLRARADVELSTEIAVIHRESRGTYGAPRVHAELAARGTRVGRKRVARLMRQASLQGVSRRRQFVTTRREDGDPGPLRLGACLDVRVSRTQMIVILRRKVGRR